MPGVLSRVEGCFLEGNLRREALVSLLNCILLFLEEISGDVSDFFGECAFLFALLEVHRSDFRT